MLCYQISAQFAFYQRKPALVSTHIKNKKPRLFLFCPTCLSVPVSKSAAFSKRKKKRFGTFHIFMRSIKAALFPTPPKNTASPRFSAITLSRYAKNAGDSTVRRIIRQ
jgi:hypothetical protein